MMKKTTEITIETERFLVISQRRKRPILWCSDCDNNMPMLTVNEAARAACTTALVISGLAETGKLHFALTQEGQTFICPVSLASVRV